MENLYNDVDTNIIKYPQVFDVVNFMCAGVVGYSDVDDGTYLLRKETLDKMLPTIVGRPVIKDHQKVTKENIDTLAVGYVVGAKYNQDSGQFDCSIIITDPQVAEKIRQGDNKVSSAYTVTQFGGSGRYLGINYDAEILDGSFTHLAIVDNPRYPDGKILINNLKTDKGDTMFFKLNKQNEEETKEEKLNGEDLVEVDGDKVELKDLIDAYRNSCKKKDNEKENKCNEEEKDDKKENCGSKNNEEEVEEEEVKEEETKENEDADNDLITKIRKVVKEMLASKNNEDKKEDKEEEPEEKENKISDYPLSNSLREASKSYIPEKFEYKTRAERIAEANKKYSL